MAVDGRDGLWETRGEGLTMGQPITKEVCEICGSVFEMPMKRVRCNEYVTAKARFRLTYCYTANPSLSQVCPRCFGEIKSAVESVIKSLKKK